MSNKDRNSLRKLAKSIAQYYYNEITIEQLMFRTGQCCHVVGYHREDIEEIIQEIKDEQAETEHSSSTS